MSMLNVRSEFEISMRHFDPPTASRRKRGSEIYFHSLADGISQMEWEPQIFPDAPHTGPQRSMFQRAKQHRRVIYILKTLSCHFFQLIRRVLNAL